jgi:hypothetical protein
VSKVFRAVHAPETSHVGEPNYCSKAAFTSLVVLGFATQGSGGNEEARLRELTRELPVEILSFDRSSKFSTFWQLLRTIRNRRPAMIIMEGSGAAGGAVILLGRWLFDIPFVVSSGDAIGPYLSTRVPWLRLLFAFYERLLYRFSTGFIGWTPYLAGRALSFGAPRVMTAAGWAPYALPSDGRAEVRTRMRRQLGISADALVLGLAGELRWNSRIGYCYGYELVKAFQLIKRQDAVALIIGSGTGKGCLEREAVSVTGGRIRLVGRVPQSELPEYLAAMDIGSLPQSVDKVGGFRYTTKISEYIAAGLPIVTGRIPLAYDLNDGWLWRLPGGAPWEAKYIEALAALIERLTPSEIVEKRTAVPEKLRDFDRELQVRRVTGFIGDLLKESCG